MIIAHFIDPHLLKGGIKMVDYIQKGDIIDYKNDGNGIINYHDVVALQNLIGIAQENIAVGDTGALAIVGVHGFPADKNDIPTGSMVYYNNGAVTVTASGVVAGVTIGPVDGGIVPVKINTGNLVVAAPASSAEPGK